MGTVTIVDVDWSNELHGRDLVSLLDEYARDPSGGGDGLAEFTKSNLFASLQKRSTCYSFLAYRDGVAAGLLISFEGFSTFACKPLLNLHDIVVSASFRGQGISKRLMIRAEAVARALGCCKMTLEVLSNNEVAKAAYKKFGFEGYQLSDEFGYAEFWQKKLV